MLLLQILQDLYNSEFNADISWVWEGEIVFSVSDTQDFIFRDFQDMARKLPSLIIKHYPGSDFAKKYAPTTVAGKHPRISDDEPQRDLLHAIAITLAWWHNNNNRISDNTPAEMALDLLTNLFEICERYKIPLDSTSQEILAYINSNEQYDAAKTVGITKREQAFDDMVSKTCQRQEIIRWRKEHGMIADENIFCTLKQGMCDATCPKHPDFK